MAHQITHWDGGDDASNWLPNGRIVFVHTASNALLGRWYIMNADGTNIESLPQLTDEGRGPDRLVIEAAKARRR